MPSGQTPGELDTAVIKVSDYAVDQHAFAPSSAIGDAVAVARVEHGAASYEGKATGRIEAEPSPGAWPAPYRVMIEGKYWYAEAIDVATGIGPARKLASGQLSVHDEAVLTGDGRVVYGDEHLAAIKPNTEKVLVVGGSATSAWNAEAAACAGARKVYWVHRTSQPEAGSPEAIELGEIARKLSERGLSETSREQLEARQRDLLSFRKAMLPRNLEPGDAAFNNPAIERSSGTIRKITPVEGGGVKVELTDGRVLEVDQVVISIGQDPMASGGPGFLLGSRQLRMVKNPAGDIAYLESDDGAIRVLGAAMSEPAMAEAVIASQRGEFTALLAKRAQELPLNSRGVAGSLALGGKTIFEGNQIIANNEAMRAAGARLPGPSRTISLQPGDEVSWPGQIGDFLAREMGVDPSRVTVTPLGGGRSGATVYNVKLGDADVGVFKVFGTAEDAAAELRAIDAIADHHLKNFKVVGNKGSVAVDAAGTAKGAVLMETAPGKTVKEQLEALPESGPAREAALADLEASARRVGQGLGEFHKSFETGREMTRDAKKSEADYLIGKLVSLRDKLDPAVYDAIYRRVIDVISEFYSAHVPETAYHGDANLGNFAVGPGGKVTTFDVGTMRYSIDANGKPIATGAADVARFANSFATEFPGKLTPVERSRLQSAFGESYFHASGTTRDQMFPAAKFYQIDMELGILRGEVRAGKPTGETVNRLLAALELPDAVRFRTDADLARDAEPVIRPGEPREAANSRVNAATAEQARRANMPICFIAGTRVHTSRGLVAIESLVAGDLVLARPDDQPDAPVLEYRVRALARGHADQLLHVMIAGTRLTTTRNHPFCVVERGWVAARDLAIGDRLSTIDGEEVVREIHREVLATPIPTFNISVDGAHSYYVSSAEGVIAAWVHNVDPNDPVFKGELLWGLGAGGPRMRLDTPASGETELVVGDRDGASAFATSSREEVGRFMGIRGKRAARSNHGAITREQLDAAGLVAVETSSTDPLSTEAGLKHYSIRPASNPDPHTSLTDAEMQLVKAKLDALTTTTKAKPVDFGCG